MHSDMVCVHNSRSAPNGMKYLPNIIFVPLTDNILRLPPRTKRINRNNCDCVHNKRVGKIVFNGYHHDSRVLVD